MVNILIATYSAYPRVGGRSTYIRGLMNELEHRGHRVDLIAHAPGLCEIYQSSGRRVDKQPIREQVVPIVDRYFDRHFPSATDWIRWREIERCTFETAIRRFNLTDYDIVHAQDILSARCLYRIKPNDVPLIVTYHNVKSREWAVNETLKHPMEMAFVRREEAVSALHADAVIFPCRWLQTAFLHQNFLVKNPHLIPYGVDGQFVESPIPTPRHTKPLIACPARLVPIKGHAYLLDALQILKSRGFHFQCWLIGDGVLRDGLAALCRGKNLVEEVHFLGNQDNVPTLLSQSDIVVLPTLHDTLPFAIMEAQLAGKPVVASRVGGIPEMISSESTGLLVEPRSSHELAEAVARLLTRPSLRHFMSQSARRWALRQWSLAKMGSETLQVYDEVMGGERGPSAVASCPDVELLEPLMTQWRGRHVSADQKGKIVGRITRADGRGVTAGTIHLMDISWVTLQTTQVNENGEFHFHDLPTAKYSLLATVPEHGETSRYVEVRRGEEAKIEMRV